ncbi:hypothetical protein M758_4G014800 [Ceratodon purpureus]|nr:hypothetical protein M758_4G014800 [Ceratodon purpureus]
MIDQCTRFKGTDVITLEKLKPITLANHVKQLVCCSKTPVSRKALLAQRK